MYTLLQDIRHGARVLRKAPGFTTVAVLILAVGIGATSTVFSVINALFLSPLNGGATDDLVRLYSRDRTGETGYRRYSYPNYLDMRQHRELFAELAAYDFDFVGVAEGPTTRRTFAGFVTASYFPVLGVSVSRGRAFTPADDHLGAPPVVIVSHDYWTASGADPGMIGRTVTVSGIARTVIGITPPGFTGSMAVTAPPLWLPLGQTGGAAKAASERLADRSYYAYGVVGRLAEGLTLASAAPGLDLLSQTLEQAYPAENRHQVVEARPLPRIGDSGSPRDTDPFGLAMVFVLAMAAVLLLIVALNLANMLLARGSERQKEMAVRLAIGAGRWSIVRQLLVEASMLSLAGGLLGLVVSWGATRLLVSTLLPLLPMFDIVFDPAPDLRVLAATLGFAALGTIVFGLGPALQLSRVNLVTGLKEQIAQPLGRGRLGRSLTRNGLVVTQIALSLTLLTAGGLFFFGAVRVTTADPGFSLERGIIAATDTSLAGYDDTRARATMLRVIERLRSIGGVESASLASTVPFGESAQGRSVQPAGAPPEARAVGAMYRVVGADYFRTLGVAVLRGREFTHAEESATAPGRVAIVDAELARRLWPDADPIGRQIQWVLRRGQSENVTTCEVVGVVGSMKRSLFDLTPPPHLYVPFGGQPASGMTLHVRGKGEGPGADTALLAGVSEAVRSVDAELPVVALKTLVEHRDTGFEVWFIRLAAQVFAVFGIVALVVAMVGVYGVRAITVGRRTREFGIRMAIGATEGDVMRLVMTEGSRLIVIGLGVGLLLSAGVSRVLAGWTYGVRTFEPGVFVTTSLLLVAAMLLACYLPARRATAVQPMTALRNE